MHKLQLKVFIISLLSFIGMSLSTEAKPKISKEVQVEAARLKKEGWKITTTDPTTLEEKLQEIYLHRDAEDDVRGEKQYIIVTTTAKAPSFSSARQKAMMDARRLIMAQKQTRASEETSTTSHSTDTTSSERMITAAHVSSSQKGDKSVLLLEASRNVGKDVEVMVILEEENSK